MQMTMEKPEYPGMSDVDGLNLVLTAPEGTQPGAHLPVIVYIHGGGGNGGNWFPQTDFRGLVKLSTAKTAPIIGVSIG